MDLPVSQIGLFLCATTEYKICIGTEVPKATKAAMATTSTCTFSGGSVTYQHHTKKRFSNNLPASLSWPLKAAAADSAEATAALQQQTPLVILLFPDGSLTTNMKLELSQTTKTQ